MSDNKNCTNCTHAIFDELWGEYKCTKRQSRVYILLTPEECPFYKETVNKEQTNTQRG